MRTESTLGTDSDPLQSLLLALTTTLGDPIGRTQNSLLHLLLILKLRQLGADNTDNDTLVLGEEFQRLKTARALGVVFQVKGVDVQVTEQLLSNDVVFALGKVTTANEVATAEMDTNSVTGQTSLVQHIKLGLINLGNVGKVLFIVLIRLRSISLALLITHVEPSRSDHGELDGAPLLLWHKLLHKLQLVQVGDRLLRVVGELAASNDRVAGHDLAILLDQAHHIGMVQTEKTGLSILELSAALELIPHESPESSPGELAASYSLEAQFLLHLDNFLDSFILDSFKTCILWGETLFTDLLSHIEESLGSKQGAHVLSAERLERSHIDDVSLGTR
ncbi:hypothetical protein HG531_004934 [Fusarium graminearum]|nr:hypothetical protein HG531_004934 [Fusarium graminearum]